MRRPRAARLTPEETEKLDQDFLVRMAVAGKRDKARGIIWGAFVTSPFWIVIVLVWLLHLGRYVGVSQNLESKLEYEVLPFWFLYLLFVAFWIGRKSGVSQFFDKTPEERVGPAPESWRWILDRLYPYPPDWQPSKAKPRAPK
jgi:hypothetical protein